jgi:uncharacterized protein
MDTLPRPGLAAVVTSPRANWPRLLGIGLAAGILSGLLGVGGGIVMVPLLVLFAGLPQRDAHATSLYAIVPISIAGIAIYGVAGQIRLGDGIPIALGAVLGARVGAGALARIDERVLKLGFAGLLLLSAVMLTVGR